jgi:hypothetical protein
MQVLGVHFKSLDTWVLTSKEIHQAVLQLAAAALSVGLSFPGRNGGALSASMSC